MTKQDPTKKAERPGRRKINPEKVMDLAEKGVSASDIAKAQGVAVSTITRFLEKASPEAKALAEFKEHRADWLHALSKRGAELLLRLLDSLEAEDLEKTSLAERKELIRVIGTLFGISQDKVAQLENKLLGGTAVQIVINTTREAIEGAVRVAADA